MSNLLSVVSILAILGFAFFIRMMYKTLTCKYCGGKIESYSGKRWVCMSCHAIQ